MEKYEIITAPQPATLPSGILPLIWGLVWERRITA